MSSEENNNPPREDKTVSVDFVDNAAEAVFGEYEKRPYPAEDESVLSDRSWKVAPARWWLVTGNECEKLPASPRILVAGCGTGNEAFNFARNFPEAEVVGVDFSPRSIEIAEKWRGPSDLDNVSFHCADIASEDFPSNIGGRFDLISCHGVASYIPKVDQVLANFSQCLKPDGSIYLGVNGSAHPSTRYRSLLEAFDLDPDKMEEPARARKVISLGDALLGFSPQQGMARQSDSYLASDVFGSVILNQSLGDWIDAAERNGLVFLNNLQTTRNSVNVLLSAQVDMMMEKDLAKLHALADLCRPASFHRIILGGKDRRRPSFKRDDRGDLLNWRPLAALFDRSKIPPQRKPLNRTSEIKLDIPGLYSGLKLNLTAYLLEFIRSSNGKNSVRQIMDQIDYDVGDDETARLLCRLHMMGVINLCQPRE